MTEKKIPTAQQMKEYRDLRGSMTTESDFEKVQAFENEYDIFTQVFTENGKMALVSPDGKGTLKTGFDYDHIVFDDCYYVLVKDGMKGLATGGGDVIIPAEMDEIYTPFNDLAAFTKDEKFGFAMIGYDLITEPVYESYDIVGESDYLQVVKDGVTGYIDESGEFTTDEDERFFHAACDL